MSSAMLNYLPNPGWDGLHPLIIHFPIALLLVAPLFVALGLLRPARLWLFSVAALILMVLGTAGVYVSVATGKATAQLVDQTPAITKAIAEHEGVAERTRLFFTLLTLIFALLVLAPRFFKRLRPGALIAMQCVFLLAYMGSCLVLARTGHLGGRLVHHFGVQALMNDPEAPPLDTPESDAAPGPETGDRSDNNPS